MHRIGVAVILAGAVLVVSGGCDVSTAGNERQAASKVEARVADLRAKGVPVDEPTLLRFHQQIASREHAEKWILALGEINSPAFVQAANGIPYLDDSAAVPVPGQPWAAQQKVEAFLVAHQPLLERVHQLSRESSPVSLPIDFDDWYAHRQELREAARMLQLEHNVAVYRGDDEQVLRSLQSLIGIGDAVRGDPLIAHQLLRVSLHGVAVRAMQLSMEHGLLDLGDEKVVAGLLRDLDRFDNFSESYRVAHVGERVLMLADYRDPPRFSDSRFLQSETRSLDALVWLDFYRRSVRVSEHDDLDSFVQASERVREKMEVEFSDLPNGGPVEAASSLRSSVAFAKALARQVMHARMAKLAVGLAAYQHRHGNWPEQLDDLSQVGVDPRKLVPLGNKLFGYRIEESYALLWGFEPTIANLPQDVPDDPPPLDSWDANVNETWVWRLPPRPR